MNDTIRFQLNQLMQDVRNVPVTDSVADMRYGSLLGYINGLFDSNVISVEELSRLRGEAYQAYTEVPAA